MMKNLRDFDKDHRLFADIDGNHVFLPYLRRVWDQIRAETPIKARAILAQKDIPQERRIAVLGLSVPERLVTWTTPVLILALSFYLLVYVLHLGCLSKTGVHIKDYPWIGILPGHIASIVSVAIHFVLPIAALLSVSIARWSGQPWGIRSLLIAFAAATVLVLAKVNVSLHQIRNSKVKDAGPEKGEVSDRGQLDQET